MKVSLSVLSSELKPSFLIEKANNTDVDFIHLDIMDGKFVENKTWTFSEVLKLTKNTSKKFDTHLMVNNPNKYIEDYALINTEYITFHYEAVKDPNEVINKIKMYGIKPGISIKPNTNLTDIIPYLKDIKQVLIMSVEPGKSGQTFMDSVLYKIETLKKYKEENNLDFIISVDGGINNETALKVKEYGADMVVSATYLHNGNMQERIDTLRC